AHGSRAPPRRTICVQRALRARPARWSPPRGLCPALAPQHLGAPSARGRELNPMLRQPRPHGPQPGTVLSALDGGQRPDTVVVLPLRRTARSSVREGDGLPRRFRVATRKRWVRAASLRDRRAAGRLLRHVGASRVLAALSARAGIAGS